MNRSLTNVLFGGISAPAQTDYKIEGSVTQTNVEDTAEALTNAESVIIVVGYGMAVAKAQYAISDITSMLRSKGIKGLRSSIAGDLYVHVQVETPVKLTDQQRDLLKQFERSLTEGGSRHSPQSKSWFDRVKSFFD